MKEIIGVDGNKYFYVLQYGEDFAKVTFRKPAFQADGRFSQWANKKCREITGLTAGKAQKKRLIHTDRTPIDALCYQLTIEHVKALIEKAH